MPHLRVTPKGGSVEEEEDLEAVSPAPPASPLNSRKTAQLPPSFTFTATVATPKLSNDKVTLTLDTAGQHTLSWTEPLSIKGAEETLPAGDAALGRRCPRRLRSRAAWPLACAAAAQADTGLGRVRHPPRLWCQQ